MQISTSGRREGYEMINFGDQEVKGHGHTRSNVTVTRG